MNNKATQIQETIGKLEEAINTVVKCLAQLQTVSVFEYSLSEIVELIIQLSHLMDDQENIPKRAVVLFVDFPAFLLSRSENYSEESRSKLLDYHAKIEEAIIDTVTT